MQNPRNLRVYEQALALALEVYQMTSVFPPTERFGLVTQMRRAAVSVGSNIAEGCGKNGNRALVACLHHSLGSLDELAFQTDLCEKLGFCTAEAGADLAARLATVRRGLIALISSLRKRADVPTI